MLKEIAKKYLLLDTNILIDSAKYANSFEPFYTKLEKLDIALIIDSSIELEFLRSANTLKNLQEKINYLELLLGRKGSKKEIPIPIKDETLKDARRLSNLYHHLKIKKNKSISAVDCLLAAHLKKYKNNLYLATANNSDFTTKIFSRIHIFNIEIEDEIKNIGIYKFSEEKYSKVLENFKKSN